MHRTDTDLMNAYLATWTLPDAAARRGAIDDLWDPEGHLTVSSTGQNLSGRDAIAVHINTVHENLIAGKGLRFSYDQSVWSGDALLLRWSMTAPDESVVGRGADVLYLTDSCQIRAAHMFMGVN